MLSPRSLPAVLVVALGALGCSGPSYDAEATATDALDSANVGAAESGVLISAATLITKLHPKAPTTPEEAAQRLASDSLPLQFKRWATCGTAVVSANTVTVTLNGCDTRRGGVINGEVAIAYSKVGKNILAVDAASKGLTIDDLAVEVHAGATITFDAIAKKVTLMVSTRSTGTGSRGHLVKRTGTYVLDAESGPPSCLELSGDWRTRVDDRLWDTTIDGFKVCDLKCPESGKLDYKGGISGVSVSLEFDGTRTAKWTDSNGHHGELPLRPCLANR